MFISFIGAAIALFEHNYYLLEVMKGDLVVHLAIVSKILLQNIIFLLLVFIKAENNFIFTAKPTDK